MLSLFVPVHVNSLTKVKFIQILLKITSIVPNLTFKGQRSSSSKIMSSTETPYTCICIGLPLGVSCKIWSQHAPYIQPIKNSIIFYLTFKGHPRSNVMRSTEIPYMTYYMCFI